MCPRKWAATTRTRLLPLSRLLNIQCFQASSAAARNAPNILQGIMEPNIDNPALNATQKITLFSVAAAAQCLSLNADG
jgi:hypothetical protein